MNKLKIKIIIIIFVYIQIINAYGSIVLRYKDPYNGDILPLTNVSIKIFSMDGKELLYTSKSSNPNGIIIIRNEDVSLATGRFYIIGVVSENNAASVTTGGGKNIFNHDFPFFDIKATVSGSQLYNTTTTMTLDDGYPVIVLETVGRVKLYAKALFGYSPPKVQIYYEPKTDKPQAVFSTYGVGYRINLFKRDFSSRDWCMFLIAHEYGHALHYELNDKEDLPGHGTWEDIHYTTTVANPEFAFTEGFADFFGSYFLKVENYNQDLLAFESFPVYYSYIRTTSNEGHVGSFLWDLIDEPTDGGCEICMFNPEKIKEILKLKPNNITEFKNKWGKKYSSDKNAVETLYNQTFIDGFVGCDLLSFSHYDAIYIAQENFIMTLEGDWPYCPEVTVSCVLAVPDNNGDFYYYEVFQGFWEPWAWPYRKDGDIGPLNWPSENKMISDGTYENIEQGYIQLVASALDVLSYYCKISVVLDFPVSIEYIR